MTVQAAPPLPSWRAALPLIALIDLALIATSGYSPWLLLGVIAGLAALLLWSSPQRALAFVIAGLPLLDPIYGAIGLHELPLPIPPMLMIVPLAVIAWSETWMESASPRPGWFWKAVRDPVVLFTLFLSVVLYIGLRSTSAPGYGGAKAFHFLIAVVLLVVSARVFLDRGADLSKRVQIGFSLLGWILVWETAIALFALWNYFSRYYVFDDRLRVAGLNTIWLARHMGLGLLALCALRAGGRISRGWALTLAALLAIVFYLSGSRGPLAALVPSLALWWILDPRRRGHVRLFVAVSASLAAIAALLWFITMGTVFGESPFAGHDASNLARLVLLKGAAEHLGTAGWWGHGTGSFGPLIGLGDTRIYPHNIFLEIWVENGLFGLALFVAFLLVVVRRWREGMRFTGAWSEEEGKQRDLMIRIAGVQWFFALACAQFSGDLPQNPWVWLWAAALFVW
jgi:O-antigen ligase